MYFWGFYVLILLSLKTTYNYISFSVLGEGGHLDLLWFSVTQMSVGILQCPSVPDFVYTFFVGHRVTLELHFHVI